ncbi:cyclopropane-fatty-acyl-phospholipid synthase family protein [Elioraea sp.]|uniref:SAM-dependent methyltransferase n=1 Tax=Elioraea sp. TaxID=2185103 RepID=UPI0025C30D8A|nr:cyclopropane-fatty-acyl-phospholipid synthase family protein [Elioraea sp.]
MHGTDTTLPATRALPRDRRFRLALKLAGLIRAGHLMLTLPDGSMHRFGGHHDGPEAQVTLLRPRAIRRFALGGSLGWAEAYLDGDWSSPDIRAVMALATANEAEWDEVLRGSMLVRTLSRIFHAVRPNTRRGAKRNIAAHYDLGNAFYGTWLDRTMTYSAAEFAAPDEALEEAQARKVRNLLTAIDLRPGQRLLEIGCGWGYLAEIAAREYGASVVALTLSREQHAHAVTRIAAAGLSDRVEIRLQDYRDVPERFDRIASVEMFEAVGEAYWPAFFTTLRERLAPGGQAGLQIITIADRFFPVYRSSADFVQRYVFPGGMLPSPTRLREEVARAGFTWQSETWFGPSYAETLRLWNERFQEAWPQISPRGYDDRFKRLWEYYLAYCETGFRAGWTDVGRIVLTRP